MTEKYKKSALWPIIIGLAEPNPRRIINHAMVWREGRIWMNMEGITYDKTAEFLAEAIRGDRIEVDGIFFEVTR